MTTIKYVKGDATAPVGDGKLFIPHVCNDIGAWGAGFVLALSRRWPDPERLYKKWKREGMCDGQHFELGNIQVVKIDDRISVINMIGQNNIRPRNGIPPIRYGAIRHCLKQVAEIAKRENASIHAPKFGAGLAGGDWNAIEQIIIETLCANDIDVTVYEF